jgi:hypothetical protein
VAAPDVPVLQRQVATALDLGTTIVGPLAENLVVVFDQDALEWKLLRVDVTGVTVLDTVAASGIDPATAIVNDGVIADGSHLFYPSTDGSTLTITNRSWSPSGYDRVYAAGGDPYPAGNPTFVLSTTGGHVVVGVGPGVSDSYTDLADMLDGQTLIGAPAFNRWLRMSGDDSGAPCTVELLDASGSVLDSIEFDHPDDSWLHNRPYGTADATYSVLWWVKPSEHLTTYLGSRLSGSSYPYTSHVVTRTLDSTGDTLAWVDAEAELGTVDEVAPENVRPYAAAWDGQLSISLRYESYG